ncbi:putative porin [Winogradskyella aurantiaca]|uniref:putative porin n=1 Tax=Winogradskyella aurantiaca TaxID=2219558 RepID=UPI000E1C6919|nr:putative porin [Winogradskyella aurantiaca]
MYLLYQIVERIKALRSVWLIVLLCLPGITLAQKKLTGRPSNFQANPALADSSNKSKKSAKFDKVAKLSEYIYQSYELDTTAVDTSLTIQKQYKFNYLRRDTYGLMQFANVGQSYNSLTLQFREKNNLPLFAGQARHFNYYRKEDINYYSVPTPFTQLYWKTVFEQGQTLNAFFTVNTSRQLNFSVAYKGLRSLGSYQNTLTSTGNFRFTTNYKTKNDRYHMRGHVVYQDLFNEENGGLKDEDLPKFVNGETEFRDRALFDPSLNAAENILVGRRFHLDHSYDLIKSVDSVSVNVLSLTHQIGYEDKYYQFNEAGNSIDYFGPSFTTSTYDRVNLEDFYTNVGAAYQNETIGQLRASIGYKDLNYGYNSIVILESQRVGNRIKNNFLNFNASYANNFGKLGLSGRFGTNFSNEFKGSFIDANVSYAFSEDFKFIGGFNINSRRPNFNFLLFQSDYVNYNWDNTTDYDNVNTQQIFAEVVSNKWVNVLFDISNIQNYTYFNLAETTDSGVRVVKPEQSSESIQYFRIKAQKEFKFGKFGLENTLLYQNSSSSALNVPEFVTRNAFYFSDEIFRKALTLQTGVIFNYFTKYHMNRYDPLLAEFYTQNEVEIGNFPRFDVFLNVKVRTARIYLMAEHVNFAWTGFNYFSAPNHPYRDFKIRFGLVWNFFL